MSRQSVELHQTGIFEAAVPRQVWKVRHVLIEGRPLYGLYMRSLLIDFGCGMEASMVCQGHVDPSSKPAFSVEKKKILYVLSYASIASSNGILVN